MLFPYDAQALLSTMNQNGHPLPRASPGPDPFLRLRRRLGGGLFRREPVREPDARNGNAVTGHQRVG